MVKCFIMINFSYIQRINNRIIQFMCINRKLCNTYIFATVSNLIHTPFIKICFPFVWIARIVSRPWISTSPHGPAYLLLIAVTEISIAISSIVRVHSTGRWRQRRCILLATLLIVTRISVAHDTISVILVIVQVEHVVDFIVESTVKISPGSIATFGVLTLPFISSHSARWSLFRAPSVGSNVIIASKNNSQLNSNQ